MALSANEPDQTSAYAAEGTAAHELAAKCLAERDDAADYIGAEFNKHTVTKEMAANVQIYLDAVRAQIVHPDDEYEVERRFYLSHISEDLFGTVDALVYQPSTLTLFVNDLKYGAGVYVDALENAQLLYYALGAVVSHGNRGVDRVVMTIHQPRIHTEEGTSRTYEVDALTLLEWGEDLRAAYKKALEARANLKVRGPDAWWIERYLADGDHCQFCKAAYDCPLLVLKREQAASAEFANLDGINADDLAERLVVADRAAANIKALRAYAFEQGKAGNLPTGYKFVAKVARRKWIDADEALNELLGRGFVAAEVTALKTPAQVEKAIGKKGYELVAEFVEKKSSGVNLVPLSHKAPAVAVDANAHFEDVEDLA